MWNYHPDAETYINESGTIALKIIESGLIGMFNNFYYIISLLLGSNIEYLIFLNIIIYSLTNVVIFEVFSDYNKVLNLNKTRLGWFAFWTLVFIPYRLHLAVHILKDSLSFFF